MPGHWLPLPLTFLLLLSSSSCILFEPPPCDDEIGVRELMYIYDEELNECFAIRSNDCAERENLFTIAQCINAITNTWKCADAQPSMQRADGSDSCDANDLSSLPCPDGAVCKGTVCCNATIETEVLTEKYVTSCAPGVKASRENGQILYSTNCTIDFCPEGVKCVMGQHFAFCCPPF